MINNKYNNNNNYYYYYYYYKIRLKYTVERQNQMNNWI